MKHIFALIGVAALLATVNNVQAAAGDPVVTGGSLTLPLTFAAGTTNYAITGTNSGPLITCKQQNQGVSATVSAGTPGATNVFYFAPSADGALTFDTNAADLFALSAKCVGTGPVTTYANFNVGGATHLRLYSVVTTGTATNGALTATNAAVNGLNYSIKTSAP